MRYNSEEVNWIDVSVMGDMWEVQMHTHSRTYRHRPKAFQVHSFAEQFSSADVALEPWVYGCPPSGYYMKKDNT